MTILTASPGNALTETAAIPGDKSCSHRALILAAMAEGESLVSGLNEADDVMRTVAAMEAFGVEVEQLEDGRWRVLAWESMRSRGSRLAEGLALPECGGARTRMA